MQEKKEGPEKEVDTFQGYCQRNKKGMNKKSKNGRIMIKSALAGARKVIKKRGGKKKFKLPNILALPKVLGGALPLIPIFAGLSALGALTNGVTGIAKAINDAKTAKHRF